MTAGELCAVVKETSGGDKSGIILGQVFKFSSFVSKDGSLPASETTDYHSVIISYWRSFDVHARSHTDDVFKKKFAKPAAMCSETKELGYDMLWQGEAGWQYHKDAIFSPCE